MFYTVKRVNCLLKGIITAQHCTPFLLALLVQELCVWLAENRKKLEIIQVHLFFGHGARMVIRHIGRKFDLIPIFFNALVNIVALFFEPSFSHHCFTLLFDVFSYCTSTESFAIVSKIDLTRRGLILDICRNMRHFVVLMSAWTGIFKNCSFVFPFWRHEIFPIFGSIGVLACSLNVPPIISYWVY